MEKSNDDSNDDSNKYSEITSNGNSNDKSNNKSTCALSLPSESNSSRWLQTSCHAHDNNCALDGSISGGAPSFITDASDSLLDELASIATEASRQKWGVAPYPIQSKAASVLLKMDVPSSNIFPTKLLVVLPTGKGKTHISKVWGSVKTGIMIFIVPSLALGSNLATKFLSKFNDTVALLHLDEIERHDCQSLRKKATSMLTSHQPNGNVFVPVVTSPQALAKKHWTKACIDVPLQRNTLTGVVIDEVQLFVEFGAYFRPEFPALKHVLFDKLRVGVKKVGEHDLIHLCCPILITTATSDNADLMRLFCCMTGLLVPPPTWIWGSAHDMKRRNINLCFIYSSDFTSNAKKLLTEFHAPNNQDDHAPPRTGRNKSMIYTNSLSSADGFKERLDDWRDEAEPLPGDIISINGSLFPEQKFFRGNLFAESLDIDSAIGADHPCPVSVLAMAGSIGEGYDNEYIGLVIHHGFPTSIYNKRQMDG